MTPPRVPDLKDCDCPEWEPNVEKINGPIMLQSTRSGGAYQYTGKPFVFCPWCGKDRRAVERAPAGEVSRMEVIDHRSTAPEVGRVLVAWPCRVELSYQDTGRTLKVFVTDAPTGTVEASAPMLTASTHFSAPAGDERNQFLDAVLRLMTAAAAHDYKGTKDAEIVVLALYDAHGVGFPQAGERRVAICPNDGNVAHFKCSKCEEEWYAMGASLAHSNQRFAPRLRVAMRALQDIATSPDAPQEVAVVALEKLNEMSKADVFDPVGPVSGEARKPSEEAVEAALDVVDKLGANRDVWRTLTRRILEVGYAVDAPRVAAPTSGDPRALLERCRTFVADSIENDLATVTLLADIDAFLAPRDPAGT